MKKTWESPKLIVLVRSNPQEALMAYCKGSAGLAAALEPSSNFTSCMEIPGAANILCVDCSSVDIS